MRLRDLGFVCLILACGLALGRGVLRSSTAVVHGKADESRPRFERPEVVRLVDEEFRRAWRERGIEPAPPAPDLAVMRRLSLALTGMLPSLEEIRRFEARSPERRVDLWLDDLLRDRRSADYLAERFARAYVGTEDGPFIQFRRRRFTTWLSDALLANRSYAAIVRDLIADRGVWTDHPATNFVSVTFDETAKLPNPERLAARVSRAFLGARIDCAQCHDHPFQRWKQSDFQALAAFFGGVHSNLRGISDGAVYYKPLDRKTKEPTTVEPRVPSHPELQPKEGTPRQQLAAWVVDPRNPYFSRATVNRVWAIVFGRPLVAPIDDLATVGEVPKVLDLLANDFSEHGFDLHRLIRTIAATEVFQLDSDAPPSPTSEPQDETWASFPMTRLRPDQVAGGIHQASAVATIGPESSWVVRFIAYTERNDFVRRYGDTGEDEFAPRSGTIPQRLLLMNGEFVEKKIKGDMFNASKRIAQLAPDDEKAVELAYLTVLTRRPTTEEAAYFLPRFKGIKGDHRAELLTDLYWTLLNATEFSWNH
jgi:Protein of unknown function (DUF1553)/Protein of unknown function (DUF1549)